VLVRDGKLGASLAAALGDKPVALMRGHGNVVIGPNVRVATARAIFTDENARMQAAALSLGGPVNYVSAAEGARAQRPGPGVVLVEGERDEEAELRRGMYSIGDIESWIG
jgi:HCOMODA/2-hydroxy-3-carboxy-muconic semialdehyde decarboxylase